MALHNSSDSARAGATTSSAERRRKPQRHRGTERKPAARPRACGGAHGVARPTLLRRVSESLSVWRFCKTPLFKLIVIAMTVDAVVKVFQRNVEEGIVSGAATVTTAGERF